MSEEIENYRREIETIFLNGNCGTGKCSIYNEKFTEWFQEQFRNAEEIVDKCEDKSIRII